MHYIRHITFKYNFNIIPVYYTVFESLFIIVCSCLVSLSSIKLIIYLTGTILTAIYNTDKSLYLYLYNVNLYIFLVDIIMHL